MNLERAIDRPGLVTGPKSAARLYNNIEYELALGEPSHRLEDAGERALALLEGRFPGVREAARAIEEPPSLSPQAGDALHGTRRTRNSCRPARRSNHPVHWRVRRPRNWLFANARAHPVATIATVTALTFVVVHFWAYIALAVIAIAALKASHAWQKMKLPDRPRPSRLRTSDVITSRGRAARLQRLPHHSGEPSVSRAGRRRRC
jgi:hypothetical protein